MHFRRPEPIPLIFMFFAIATLLTLGFWQTERLQWKNALLASIKNAQAMPELLALPQDTGGLMYRNVRLTGIYRHDKALHFVGPRQQGDNGVYIVTPFRLPDGRMVLVNRGWSPPGKEATPDGVQAATGIIRPLRSKRFFSPANQPERNLWFYEDIPAIDRKTGLTLLPFVIEAAGKREAGIYPQPGEGRIVLRNDHLAYAITWFSLAFIGIIMFLCYYRIPNTSKNTS